MNLQFYTYYDNTFPITLFLYDGNVVISICRSKQHVHLFTCKKTYHWNTPTPPVVWQDSGWTASSLYTPAHCHAWTLSPLIDMAFWCVWAAGIPFLQVILSVSLCVLFPTPCPTHHPHLSLVTTCPHATDMWATHLPFCFCLASHNVPTHTHTHLTGICVTDMALSPYGDDEHRQRRLRWVILWEKERLCMVILGAIWTLLFVHSPTFTACLPLHTQHALGGGGVGLPAFCLCTGWHTCTRIFATVQLLYGQTAAECRQTCLSSLSLICHACLYLVVGEWPIWPF